MFGKDIPIVCSNEYGKQLSELGFCNLFLIKNSAEICNIEIILVKGQHGTGAVGKLMGNSYGFILRNKNKESVYITGDTVWCKCVESALETYLPKYIIAFAGSAMMNHKHITLDENDMYKIMSKSPDSKVIAIHMEAWNHCRLTRSDLKKALTM